MRRELIVGAVLIATTWAGFSLNAQAVTDVVVSGGSVGLNVDLTTDPAAILLLTSSEVPADLSFTKEPGETEFALTLTQINNTAMVWMGLEFSLDGGSFTEAPRPTLGGASGIVLGPDNTRAQLLSDVSVGALSLVDLRIQFGAGTSSVLTVTPIVPEPGLGVGLGLLLLTTPRRGCRRERG